MAVSVTGQVDGMVMDRFHVLEIIAKWGVGYGTIDVAVAQERGIVVTNTPDVLTEEVADFVLGLLIATSRQLPQADAYLRAWHWPQKPYPLAFSFRGRKIGLLGQAIAERLTAINLELAYCARTPPDLPHACYPDAPALAGACETLVVIVSGGGAETACLVDARVIQALDAQGILVNVARGPVMDESALVAALPTGKLGAAGRDVVDDEPQVLRELQNTALLPLEKSGGQVRKRPQPSRGCSFFGVRKTAQRPVFVRQSWKSGPYFSSLTRG